MIYTDSKTVFNGKLLSLSESDDGTQLNGKVLVCPLDEGNLNGVGIKETDAKNNDQYKTLINQPAVAKVIINDNDELDFSGHNLKKVTVIDENNQPVTQYIFDTQPIGVFTTSDIELVNIDGVDKPCIVANVIFWTRYENSIEVIKRLFDENNLHVSWEITYSNSVIENNIKWLTEFTFIGVAILGGQISPAYPSAGVIEISEINQDEKDISEAVKKDLIQQKKIEQSELDKDKFGKSDKLSIDLTKDSASNKTWSDVDKTNLMQQLLYCSNYKTATKKGYLIREDGWEDSPSTKLKYPVVEITDNTIVLNINGCQSARSMLMANDSDNTTAINMLKKYYNILDLTWDEDESSDTETSQINNKNEKEEIEGGNNEMAENKNKKTSMASITNNDLYNKLWDAVNATDMDNYYYISFVFPYEYKCYAYTWDSDDTSFIEFTYTVNSDDTISITGRKDVQLQFAQKADIEAKDNEIAELKKSIAEKDDSITKIGEELSTKDNTIKEKDEAIAQLTPFKEKVEKAEKEAQEKEVAEKKESLKVLATKGGYISEKEIETSEEIKTLIENLDEKGIKAMIAERVIAKVEASEKENKEKEPKVETSSIEDKKETVNLNSMTPKDKIDEIDVMTSFLS